MRGWLSAVIGILLVAAPLSPATASNVPVHIVDDGASGVTLTACDVNRDRVLIRDGVVHKTSAYSLDAQYAPFAPGTEWAEHVGFHYRVNKDVKAVKVRFDAIDAFGAATVGSFDLTLTGYVAAGGEGGNIGPDSEVYDTNGIWSLNEDIRCYVEQVAYADGTVWTRPDRQATKSR
jgi:hypothetical protein